MASHYEISPRNPERSLASHATEVAEGLIRQSPFDPDAAFISLDLASRPGQNPYDLRADFIPSVLANAPKNPHGIHDEYALLRRVDANGLYSYAFGQRLDRVSLVGICWTSGSDTISKVVGVIGHDPHIKPPQGQEAPYYVDLLDRAISYDRYTHRIILTLSGKNKIVRQGFLASLTHAAGKLINGY